MQPCACQTRSFLTRVARTEYSGMQGRRIPTLALLLATAAALPTKKQLYDPHGHPTTAACANKHGNDADCEKWATAGECDNNPGFMRKNCAQSCVSCGWVDSYCAELIHKPPAKKGVGAITATFEHMATRSDLGAKVHSSPSMGGRPWVMTFDNFISEEEVDAFIESTDEHFARSLAGDVVSPVRTSQQAWCQVPPCVGHPLVNRVHERVVNLTGVPKENAEFFQVLKYEPGQFYKVHHDQNAHPDSLMGVRLFTFFIYLRSPEAGGATYFPNLNITVAPKAGSALIWPNVKDHDLRASDMRTEHEALPPHAGRKYSANLWLHNYDFRGPNTHGCDVGSRVKRTGVAAGLEEPTESDGVVGGEDDAGMAVEL